MVNGPCRCLPCSLNQSVFVFVLPLIDPTRVCVCACVFFMLRLCWFVGLVVFVLICWLQGGGSASAALKLLSPFFAYSVPVVVLFAGRGPFLSPAISTFHPSCTFLPVVINNMNQPIAVSFSSRSLQQHGESIPKARRTSPNTINLPYDPWTLSRVIWRGYWTDYCRFVNTIGLHISELCCYRVPAPFRATEPLVYCPFRGEKLVLFVHALFLEYRQKDGRCYKIRKTLVHVLPDLPSPLWKSLGKQVLRLRTQGKRRQLTDFRHCRVVIALSTPHSVVWSTTCFPILNRFCP